MKIPDLSFVEILALFLLDVIVGLSETSYTVPEGSSTQLCVVIGSDREHLQSEVEVIITTASDGSA